MNLLRGFRYRRLVADQCMMINRQGLTPYYTSVKV